VKSEHVKIDEILEMTYPIAQTDFLSLQ